MLNTFMKRKYDELIIKLKLDHKKYRELINQSHLIVEKILEIDERLDSLYEINEWDQDVEQGVHEQRDHLLSHLNDNWEELKEMGVLLTKDEFYDLVDYQNIAEAPGVTL